MSRIVKGLIGNIITHNMVQGLNRENIFIKNKYKEKYFELMKKFYKQFDIKIIAYCIMDNHVHLLLYTEDIQNITKFMERINLIYAKYYNKVNNRVGYVFRGRFYMKPIYSQNHLFRCIKYIHMNPVKKGIVKGEAEYKFSSYNDYFAKKNFINSEVLNLVFGSEENYLKNLESIEYQEIPIEENRKSLEKAISDFLILENISKNQIKEDDKYLNKLILFLLENSYRINKTAIAEILEISRSALYRRLYYDKKRQKN